VIGSETFGGARNVSVRNCTFVGTDVGIRLKSLRGKGGTVEKIFVDGVRMRGIQDEAILLDMFYGEEGSEAVAQPVSELTPRFSDISINDVVCLGAGRAVLVKGLPEMPANTVVIRNTRITADEGALCINATGLMLSRCSITPVRGPVLTLRESRDVTIEQTDVPPAAELFLRVEGEHSRNILLSGLNLQQAKKGIETGPGVPPGAVIPGGPEK